MQKVVVDSEGFGGPGVLADAPLDQEMADFTIDLSGRRDSSEILRRIRRMRFPELFRLKFSREFVRTHRVSDESLQSVVRELRELTDPVDKFVLIFHPAFKRQAIMELVRNPSDGGACYYVSMVVQTPAKPGVLPVDLQTADRLFEHHRGNVGEFKRVDSDDIRVLRYYGDKRLAPEESCRRLNEQQDRQDQAEESKMCDFDEDFHDYYFLAINTAANGGKKQYCLQNQGEVDRRRLDRPTTCNIHQRSGFRIRTKKGSRFDVQLLSENQAAVDRKAEANEVAAQEFARRSAVRSALALASNRRM